MNSLENLWARLEKARAKHAQDPKEGSRDALAAVIEFIEDLGATKRHTAALGWMLHQFEPKKEAGNLKPLFHAYREAVAAAAIDLLMESGLSEIDASNAVSKAMGGKKTGKQLRDWRGNVSERKARPEAQDAYFKAKKEFRHLRETRYASLLDEVWREALIGTISKSYGIDKA